MEEYDVLHWPLIRAALDQLLMQPPGENKYFVSFQETYSAVYKCVCRMQSERLYVDVLGHVVQFLKTVEEILAPLNAEQFIYKFHKLLCQYMFSLQGITPIFTYMDRCYLSGWRRTDLDTELRRLFAEHVADHQIERLMFALRQALSVPLYLQPKLVAELCNSLHRIKPSYAQDYPDIFGRFVPNVLPPMQESDLAREIEQTRQLQQELRNAGFSTGDGSRKRGNDGMVDDSDERPHGR